MYFEVQYSTDNVSWTTLLSDESVTVGNSSTHSAPAIPMVQLFIGDTVL